MLKQNFVPAVNVENQLQEANKCRGGAETGVA